MVRRAILVAALAFGCDDPEVSSRAAEVLVHGAIHAQVKCESSAICSGLVGSSPNYPARVVATQFQDGTSHLSFAWYNWYGSEFNDRGDPIVGRSPASDLGVFTVEVGAGEASLELEGSMTCGSGPFKTFDLETDCTGFNLEAFGVE